MKTIPTRLLHVAALGVALCSSATAEALDLNELEGRWRMPAGSTIEIAPDENGIYHGYLVEPTTDATNFGYLRNEQLLQAITIAADEIRFAYGLRPQRPELVAISSIQYVQASAQLLQDPKRLLLRRPIGTFVATVEGNDRPADCRFVPQEGFEEIVLTLVETPSDGRLVITTVTVIGFRADEPEPADVTALLLPRFFADEQGHASVDLERAEAQRARVIRIELFNPEDGPDRVALVELTQPNTLPVNPISGGRWVTLDLHERLATQAQRSLFDQEAAQFGIELEFPDGATVRYDSPPADQYRIFDWIRHRARSLSHHLLKMPLEEARAVASWESADWARQIRARIAWDNFLNQRDTIQVFVDAGNADPERPVTATISCYALFNDGTFEHIGRMLPTLEPEETVSRLFELSIPAWPEDKIARLRGIQVVAGEQPEESIRRATEDDQSVIKRFSIDVNDPRREVARRIRAIPDALHAADAAEKFLRLFPNEHIPSAQHEARRWAALLDEFEALLARWIEITEVFAGQEIGRLHQLLAEAKETLHIGGPVTTPAWVPVGYSDTVALDERFTLEKPDSEALMRGLIAAASGGRLAGELPIESAAQGLLRRDEARWRQSAVTHDSQRWQTPRGYIDAFLALSPEEAYAMVLAIESRKPLHQVRGDMAEAFTSREHGRRRVRELKVEGRKPIYLNGWSLREYNFTLNEHRLGTMIGDGVVLSPDGEGPPVPRKARVHDINEVKAGDADETNAREQLKNHERRFREHGLTVVRPTRDEINYFRRHFGIEPRTIDINKTPTTILHLEPGRLLFDSPASLHHLVTASDYEAAGPTLRLRSRKAQIDDLALDLTARHGLRLTPWNEPMHSLRGYLDYHQALVDATLAPPEPRDVITRHYLNGERYTIDAKRWEHIFVGPLENTDPFMSWAQFRRYLLKERGLPKERVDGALKRQFHEEGWRCNAMRPRGFKVPHLIDPHDPTLTREEQLRYYRAMAPRGGLTDQEVIRKIEQEQQVFDIMRARWVRRDAETAFEPAPAPGLNPLGRLRRMRSTTGGAVAGGALAMLAMVSHGVMEGNRVAQQRLRVMVRRKTGSAHTFIIVDRGETGANGTVPAWYPISDPWLQKLLLVEWFRGGRGFQFFEDTHIPLWLQHAAPDGPNCSWFGPRPS